MGRMRRLPLLSLLVLLAACRGTSPYTRQDLAQVRHAYRTITPIYRHFKRAYAANNLPAMRRWYHREQRACRLVDQIDQRDTIDANTNLFAASTGLDSLCNDIEYAYAGWREAHGLRYNTKLTPGDPATVFVDGDIALLKMPREMRHPAGLA
jgi:hypothetical protein